MEIIPVRASPVFSAPAISATVRMPPHPRLLVTGGPTSASATTHLSASAPTCPCSSPTHAPATPISQQQTPDSSPPVLRYAHLDISQHHMTTHAKAGVFQPKKFMNLHVTTQPAISHIPSSYRIALKDPHWYNAMLEELQALMTNNTWGLVPKPAGANVVSGKWIFRHNLHSDGSLARYKARWVVCGYSQQEGIDYGETFSLVIKPGTILSVLSIATSFSWPIHQLDVKNTFLHGTLSEIVYSQQPSGFVDPSLLHHVCKLHKSLYGLKQAPRTWFLRFMTFLSSIGFKQSKCDPSLFILKTPSTTAYLLLYVDDIILTANTSHLLSHIISQLCSEFSMSDLGPLCHFLGIEVTPSDTGLILSQKQYALDILARANMTHCNACHTPVDTNSKPTSTDGCLLSQPTVYRSLAGAL
jgi:hypothetical protein